MKKIGLSLGKKRMVLLFGFVFMNICMAAGPFAIAGAIATIIGLVDKLDQETTAAPVVNGIDLDRNPPDVNKDVMAKYSGTVDSITRYFSLVDEISALNKKVFSDPESQTKLNFACESTEAEKRSKDEKIAIRAMRNLTGVYEDRVADFKLAREELVTSYQNYLTQRSKVAAVFSDPGRGRGAKTIHSLANGAAWLGRMGSKVVNAPAIIAKQSSNAIYSQPGRWVGAPDVNQNAAAELFDKAAEGLIKSSDKIRLMVQNASTMTKTNLLMLQDKLYECNHEFKITARPSKLIQNDDLGLVRHRKVNVEPNIRSNRDEHL